MTTDSGRTTIARVTLRNYKSIAACDVKLAPLTVLVGPNGSGKSRQNPRGPVLPVGARPAMHPA